MQKNTNFRESILKDLEDIYAMAMRNENFGVVLKAKELLGREFGLFSHASPSSKKGDVALKDLSDDDITRLIGELEEQLTLDPKETEE